jgi:hypothetical protein
VEKKMKTMIRRLLGGLAVLALGSSLASAATITWYNNIFFPGAVGGATNAPQGAPNQYTVPFSSTVDIPQLDITSAPSGFHYQLTSVQIVLSWAITGAVGVANGDAVNHTFNNAFATIPVSLVGPDSTTVNGTALAGPASGTAVPGFAVNPTTNWFSGLTGSGTSNNTVIGPGLAAYQGVGANNLSFTFNSGNGSYGGVQTDGSGSLFFGGSAQVGATIQVTYNYDQVAVPEPGTFAILGSALIGLGVVVRRRRKNA